MGGAFGQPKTLRWEPSVIRERSCLLHRFLNLDELKDAVLHFLDSLEFSETHAALVGDVVDATFCLSVFTTGSAHLQVELAGNLLKLGTVSCELGEFDVDGSTDGGSEIGWAEGKESETVVVAEGDALFDFVDSAGKTTEDLSEIASHLHGDDTKVILFVAPDQEGFVVIVVDTTASWPVTAGIGSLEETIALLEQEVIINQLLLDILAHSSQGVVFALQLTGETGKGLGDFLFHFLVHGLGEAGVEGVSFHGATASHSGRDHILALRVDIDKGVNITEVLGRVLVGLLETNVVVFNDGVKEGSEKGVSLGIRGVDTDTRVKILNTRLNNIKEGCTKLGLFGLELIKDALGKVFLQERFAIGGSLKLLEASLQFSKNSGINHV